MNAKNSSMIEQFMKVGLYWVTKMSAFLQYYIWGSSFYHNMYLMLHNLENTVAFTYKEFRACQIFNMLHSLMKRQRKVGGVVGEELPYNGSRFQIYLDSLLGKVNVSVGN